RRVVSQCPRSADVPLARCLVGLSPSRCRRRPASAPAPAALSGVREGRSRGLLSRPPVGEVGGWRGGRGLVQVPGSPLPQLLLHIRGAAGARAAGSAASAALTGGGGIPRLSRVPRTASAGRLQSQRGHGPAHRTRAAAGTRGARKLGR